MATSAETRAFALADVQKHNKPDDIWIVIHNKGMSGPLVVWKAGRHIGLTVFSL